MGMFDYINYEAELPLSKNAQKLFSHIDLNKEPFQTKDFDNTMSKYIVNKNGNLYIEIVKGEYVENPKPKGYKGWWSPLQFNEIKRYNKKFNHTGNVVFYNQVHDKKGNEYWLEFNATFIKGKVTEIKQFKFELSQTAEEIEENDRKFKEMLDEYTKSPYTKFKKFANKITFGGWDFFWRRIVFRGLYELQNGIGNFRMFLIKRI